MNFLYKSVGFGILDIEAKEWGNFHHYHREQAEHIAISVLIVGGFVSDSSRNLTGRLSERSCVVGVKACLRWGDLLNTPPAATALMKEGLVGISAKTKTMGKSGCRKWGKVIMHFLKKNGRVWGPKCSETILGDLVGMFGYANR